LAYLYYLALRAALATVAFVFFFGSTFLAFCLIISSNFYLKIFYKITYQLGIFKQVEFQLALGQL
jgi:hypothetical protein